MRIAPGLGALALVLAATSGPALAAEVFRIQDSEGIITYTNLPPEPAGVSLLPPPPPPPESAGSSTAVRRTSGPHDAVIRAAAVRHGVDEALVRAIVVAESGGNPRAVSPKGALGLMQLMPYLAIRLNVRDPFDPAENVSAGVRHLQHLLTRFPGRLDLALAAYNAGEAAVRASRGIPPYPETQRYVQAVLQHWRAHQRSEPLADGPEDVTRTASEVRAPDPSPAAPPASSEVVYRYVLSDGTILLTNISRDEDERR